MATLEFKGKNIIWNYHMSVPYHTLELDEKLSYKQDKANGNLIVEGDNLLALKSLLPQYTGKIKCIYIDPPYNTGNDDWIYNDNVNSPLIKEWLGKEVSDDDLTRHDKWLSMMTPRLHLMRELLSEDGLIFISIDDNEVHRLRSLMDEIWGEENFFGQITVVINKGGRDYLEISKVHEYLICYGNSDKSSILEIPSKRKDFKYKDNIGKYLLRELRNRNPKFGRHNRPNLFYPIYVNPNVQDEYGCNPVSISKTKEYSVEVSPYNSEGKESCWRWGKETLESNIKENVVGRQKSDGGWNIYEKYRKTTKKVKSLWDETEMRTELGTRTIREIFGQDVFPFPKSPEVLKRVAQMSLKGNDYIIDAFAGSGTTAQAVLELNEEDKGNRKFILIQMPENSKEEPNKNICRDITRERVVKVIEKKLENKEVGFEYKRVGQPIDAETILSGQLPTYKELAKYVFYLATGQSPKDKDIDEKKYLAGKIDNTEVYLLYTPDMEELKKMAITFEWAKDISKGNESRKIVYAPACFMDDEYLEQFNMKFVSIPYNLFEREK